MLSNFVCPCCGMGGRKEASAVNRARRDGYEIYCSRECAGLARRKHKSAERKKAEKAEYDRLYRLRDPDQLRRRKAEYFRRTYDPTAAAAARKARMPKHVEYCRQPEYKKKKAVYDREHRAVLNYGEFAEAFVLVQDIDQEIVERSSKYEIRIQNGTLNKSTRRKRAAARGSVALG